MAALTRLPSEVTTWEAYFDAERHIIIVTCIEREAGAGGGGDGRWGSSS